jgi:hypothetical protein
MDVVKVRPRRVRIAFALFPATAGVRRQSAVSNLVQVLSMLAIPAAVLLTCRYLNLRGDRQARLRR